MNGTALFASQGAARLAAFCVPAPAADEIVVAVAASGLNRADLLQLAGKYPAPAGAPADILGLEFAGTVVQAGPLSGWAVGDQVMAVVAGGGHASHVCLPGDQAMRVPANIALADAAALPEVLMTVHDALTQARAVSSETLLIHAVASGIGTAAIQLGKARGMRVVGTTRSASKLAALDACGLALDERVLVADEPSDLPACDVVLDTLGGAYVAASVRALRPGGRMICLSTLAGASAAVPLGQLLAKRATIIGTVLRSRSRQEKAALAQSLLAEVLPWVADGRCRPIVDHVFAAADYAQALQRLAANQAIGKILLRW